MNHEREQSQKKPLDFAPPPQSKKLKEQTTGGRVILTINSRET